MNLLEQFLGGGPQQQNYQDYQNFVNRYDQGAPWEGYSAQEVLNRYQQIAPQLPANVFQQAAHDSLSRMQPHERQQLGQFLQQQAQSQGINIPGLNQEGAANRFQDPGFLSQIMGQMHQQHQGLLPQLLSGIAGGGGSSGGGSLMGSIGEMMGGGGTTGGGQSGGSLLSNPLAKAALAGITAMAVKRFTGQH